MMVTLVGVRRPPPADALVAAPNSAPLAEAVRLPSVAVTTRPAQFDGGDLKAGQHVLIRGAGGVVDKFAIAPVKRAGRDVIATASLRSPDAVRAAGTDEIIDHTEIDVLNAVSEQVDLLLNPAPIAPGEFTALVRLVRDGRVLMSTTAWMAAPDDAEHGVSSVVVFDRSVAEKLAELVILVDSEDPRRRPLAGSADGASGVAR